MRHLWSRRGLPAWLLALVTLPGVAGPLQRTVEEAALAAYSAACLASPSAEVEIPKWAAAVGASLVESSEYGNLVLGTHRGVWRVPGSDHRIYVALGEKLGCSVWFESEAPEPAVQAFRDRVKMEIEHSDTAGSRTEVFKEGPVSPRLWSLSYVTRFEGLETGLMWAVYVSTTAGAKTIWYTASRVRVKS